MLRRPLKNLSIEKKLPAAICVVLVVVVATLAAMAYHEVAWSARRAAVDRLENFARRLADTLESSARKGMNALAATASKAPLPALLRSINDPAGMAAAQAELDDRASRSESRTLELWDRDRRRLLGAGPRRDRIGELNVDELVAAQIPDTGSVGKLTTLDGQVLVPAIAPVIGDEDRLGYLVSWTEIPMSAGTREQVAGFLDADAQVRVGSPNGVWMDWEHFVPEPHCDLAASGTVLREGGSDGAAFVVAVPASGTPWYVYIEYPERAALGPARHFFWWVAGISVLLLLAGSGGVWLLTRRITEPLRQLTSASEEIAGGSYSRRMRVDRGDEVGRLSIAFNRMAESVEESHARVEAKLIELRTARESEQVARAQAEAANSRKDEFLAMLAHELRNPLSPILSALAILRSVRATDSTKVEALGAIERQVSNMTRIIDDLLDVSRITRGKVTLKRRRVDVGGAVTNAIETARPLVDAKQHVVTRQLPPLPLFIDADATRMEQVLANLITNAAKYTEPGGQIWVSAQRDDADVVFRVRDTGIGIAPDKLPQIFELFHQLDTSIDRSRGGLGIGLTLVRKLVELHGGTVTATSEGAGHGSEFVVRVPLAAPPPAAARADLEPLASEHRPPPDPLRILVIEDAQDSRELLKVVLEMDGHEVVASSNGYEGIARFKSFDPQVVVLDIGLPGMTGYDLARQIRAMRGGDVLLIAATGYGDEQSRALARDAGFDEHLVKPLDHAQFTEVLARAQRRHHHEPKR